MLSLSSQSTLISGVERDSPLGFLGCHLWHLLSLQKNTFKCKQCTGFLNNCPSTEIGRSAKLSWGWGQVSRRVVPESRVQEWQSWEAPQGY